MYEWYSRHWALSNKIQCSLRWEKSEMSHPSLWHWKNLRERCREGKLKQNPEDSLTWEDGGESSGRLRQLEFIDRIPEKRDCTEKTLESCKWSHKTIQQSTDWCVHGRKATQSQEENYVKKQKKTNNSQGSEENNEEDLDAVTGHK